jgi:hypothetical protein
MPRLPPPTGAPHRDSNARSLTMRDLTFHEIDEQLAEQLPSRELMGSSGCRSSCGQSGFTYNQGSYDGNGNGNGNWALINVSGNGNGNLDGNNVIL